MAVGRNQAVVQALEGIENGEVRRSPPPAHRPALQDSRVFLTNRVHNDFALLRLTLKLLLLLIKIYFFAQRAPPEDMFGGALADPFEGASWTAGLPTTDAARARQLGKANAPGEANGASWVPSRPNDPRRPFLVLSALAALNGLDPAAQVRPPLGGAGRKRSTRRRYEIEKMRVCETPPPLPGRCA